MSRMHIYLLTHGTSSTCGTCAEPRPSAAGIDAFHEFGSVRHILNKPVNRLHGDQFVRMSAAERADFVTVKLGMLEAR